MSIEQLDQIDIISVDPSSRLVLTLADHLEWDTEHEHLYLLQEKINQYLTFITSGQILDRYPDADRKVICISLASLYEPNERVVEFLHRCKDSLNNVGVTFEWKTTRG
jgi:uncharacterized protein DUF6572